MLFQAHRGVSTEYPENTMPAFEAAYAQGYQVIELDPAFTADGQCVTFHDKTVNRTCRHLDGTVIAEETPVADLTYDQLQQLDAGLFMGQRFAGTKVPLLSQVLSYASQVGVLVKLDNKFESKFTPQQQARFFEIVECSGARVAFTCKYPETISKVVERFPDSQIHYDGVVTEENVARVKALLKNNPLTVWLALPSELTSWVTVPMASPQLCEMVKHYGNLGVWILETREQLEQAKVLGADIIETTGSIKPECMRN